MGPDVRTSLTWLHTWAGLCLGAVLFAVFWTGTLSVFDREIDRWMMPETRLAPPAGELGLDAILDAARDRLPEQARRWQFFPPTERQPVVRFNHQAADGTFATLYLDPRAGVEIPDQGTLAGTRFLFPFHYTLHVSWQRLGVWLVGLASMAMLALLVSGVLIHRKIVVDFFTLRWTRKPARTNLDLHNLTGVLGLPFHFMITLSGLIIFFAVYFPGVIHAVYGDDRAAFRQDAAGSVWRDRAGVPAQMASLDAMAATAAGYWNDEPPYLVRIWHPNDVNAIVEMRRTSARSVALRLDTVYFDAATGTVLKHHTPGPVHQAQRVIAGLHFIQFDHWTLRWLYFVLGLSGCVLIATGFIHWTESRRKRHAAQGLPGVRIVQGLSVGTVTGLVVATLVFLTVNRLLPLEARVAGIGRASLEVWAFYAAWLLCFALAWRRPGQAWRTQCWMICALALAAALLNGITTGDHLLKTLAAGYWPVAGLDLGLLGTAIVAGGVARRLGRRSGSVPAKEP